MLLSPNKPISFGLNYLERVKSNFDGVVLKMNKLLISKENGIIAILNFGIEV